MDVGDVFSPRVASRSHSDTTTDSNTQGLDVAAVARERAARERLLADEEAEAQVLADERAEVGGEAVAHAQARGDGGGHARGRSRRGARR